MQPTSDCCYLPLRHFVTKKEYLKDQVRLARMQLTFYEGKLRKCYEKNPEFCKRRPGQEEPQSAQDLPYLSKEETNEINKNYSRKEEKYQYQESDTDDFSEYDNQSEDESDFCEGDSCSQPDYKLKKTTTIRFN
jgi:hypothetical protein